MLLQLRQPSSLTLHVHETYRATSQSHIVARSRQNSNLPSGKRASVTDLLNALQQPFHNVAVCMTQRTAYVATDQSLIVILLL